jgi:eukaryotic-like serine/threonine-protein kinase
MVSWVFETMVPQVSIRASSRHVLAMILALSWAAMLVACTRGSKEPDSQRTGESTSAASSAAAHAAEPIVFSIDALPLAATIFVDDVALPSNPYEAERPRDARSHVIRVEAPGYEPRSSRVAFSAPVQMHVELVPSPHPAAGSPAVRPPAGRSASGAP